MDSVKCLFCPNPPEYKPLAEMEQHSAKVFFCFKCNAEYTLWNGNQNKYYSLYTVINNKMYRWSSNNHSGYLYYIKTPGTPGIKANADMVLVKAFPDLQSSITPINIKEKIKIILTFS